MTNTETRKYQREHFAVSPVANPKAVVGGTDGAKYRFTVLTPRLVRYEWAEDGVFEDRSSSFAVHRDLPAPDFELVDEENNLEIITPKLHLRYDKLRFSPGGLTVLSKDNVTDWKSLWRYGGGIKQEEYQLHGTARTLDECNGRTPLGDGVLSRNGYSTFDDSNSILFTEDGGTIGRRPGDRIDGYIFCFGYDFKDAMKDFYAVSGNQPLLPRWALGNWWSRYFVYTDKSYLALLDRFRDEGIPFSVGVIDMDWHWVDESKVHEAGVSGWTGYSWNTNLFPQPKAFLDEVHERGLKITVNDHPADGVASYEDSYSEMCDALKHKPRKGDAIAFDIASKSFRDAYFDVLLKKLEDDGVDFWWVDWQQGTISTKPGVDPLWALNHFHFLNNCRDRNRPLCFSRFAGPGSHRYPVGFSGDAVITWDSLDFQPEFTATSSNIGYGWWSHDIGGHMQGYRDEELTARWIQYGVFSPILRLHSNNNPWLAKEPWNFAPEARGVITEALRLRHRLVPYLYSMNIRSARDDEPLVQPVYWHHPTNDRAYAYRNTYYFGSELFVAALTSPRTKILGRSQTTAWLPPGRHVDIFSGNVYDGDRVLWFFRTLDQYAVFASEGSIIPLDAAEKPKNGAGNPESLEIKVIVGADTAFELYEDDGMGSTVEEVNWITTPIKFEQSSGVLTVGPANKTNSAVPGKRDWTVNFIALPSSTSITASVDDHEQKVERSVSRQGVSITLAGVSATSKIQLSLGSNPQLKVQDPLEEVFNIINVAQMEYEPKQPIWESVKNHKIPLATRLGQLQTLGYDRELIAAITEHLCADSRWQG